MTEGARDRRSRHPRERLQLGAYYAGAALTEAKHYDKHLAVEDRGPVIYTRMSDLPNAFPR